MNKSCQIILPPIFKDMEEPEDEVVNIIGIDSDNLFFVENDMSNIQSKVVIHKYESNQMLDSEPNEKKKRGRKKSFAKQIRKKENPVECSTCARVFTTLRSLQRHTKFIHELKGLSKCDICGKDVQWGNDGMRKHKMHVHEKVRDQCDLCNKSVSKWGLVQHKMRHHPPPSCDYCKVVFKSLEEFNKHIQDHIAGKVL